jgi:hypothetical protein
MLCDFCGEPAQGMIRARNDHDYHTLCNSCVKLPIGVIEDTEEYTPHEQALWLVISRLSTRIDNLQRKIDNV